VDKLLIINNPLGKTEQDFDTLKYNFMLKELYHQK